MSTSFTNRLPRFVTFEASVQTQEAARQDFNTKEPSDEDLIVRICRDDKDALETLFRRYARAVHGISYRVLRNSAEADDLVQEIFLLVNRDCRACDISKGSVRFWIFQMAYRRAISRRRYLSARHFYTSLNLDEVADELLDKRPNSVFTVNAVDEEFGNGSLKRIFDDLSSDQRETLRLFFMEGYTLEEIAAKLRQSRGNIKHHYFRGLEKLRRHLFSKKLPAERTI